MGTLHPITLRFIDSDLEGSYQTEEGAAGLSGCRIITGATVVLWAVAVVLFPLGTEFPAGPTKVFGSLMSAIDLAHAMIAATGSAGRGPISRSVSEFTPGRLLVGSLAPRSSLTTCGVTR